MARRTPIAEQPDPEVWLRNLPKAELHLHLEGSITPETLVELSRTNDLAPLTPEAANRVYQYTDFPSFLMSFKAVTERLHTPRDYETITYAMLRDLATQGVRHAEAYIGIGIGGDEARGPAHEFRELYQEAKENGLHLTCHAGESTGPQSIWAALNIGAERIGHALTAQQDPDLIEVLAHRQIPLELNITSNLRTGCCPSLLDHPAKRYFEEGLMVTLNSDDPPFFGANLLDEYLLAHREFEFSLEQLREIAANSIEASFLAPERKLALLGEIERYGW